MMIMSLSMVEAKLPAGFRFHPRDDELICDYLIKMVAGCDQPPLLIVVDLNKSEPWDIPEIACVGKKEYYFYSQRDRKYSTGLRTNRATISGYWKATGKDRAVLQKGTLVGMRKTLVFYKGRAPKGKKTDWVMHEFRLEGPLAPPRLSSSKEDWVLCRVFLKNKDPIAKQEIMDYNDIIADDQEEDQKYSPPSSSSLPPLMDPYLTFDQTQTNPNYDDHVHEQVPCFSIFATDTTTHHHLQQPFSYLMSNHHHHHHHHSPEVIPSTKSTLPSLGGFMPADYYFGSSYNLNTTTTATSSCDQQKVLKDALKQLAKMDHSGPNILIRGGGGSPSFGEGEATTSESTLLSEVDLSAMWNNQYN